MAGLRGPSGLTLEIFGNKCEDFLYQRNTMGCRVVFLLFPVAFRTGRREEKHGIYCVGQTLLTLVKRHVLY